jgi:hypothetical protein
VYKLKLPAGAKKFTGAPPLQLVTLPPPRYVRVCLEPEEATKYRVARGCHELLVKWKGQSTASASWVDLEEFKQLYPQFQLTDELILQGGRDGMLDVPYQSTSCSLE